MNYNDYCVIGDLKKPEMPHFREFLVDFRAFIKRKSYDKLLITIILVNFVRRNAKVLSTYISSIIYVYFLRPLYVKS